MGYIYLIRCTVPGNKKVYVGQTIGTVPARFNGHKSAARYNQKYLDGDVEASHNKRGMCSKLYRAVNKYGEDNFTIEILEECDDSMLDELETMFIEEFDSVANGYNLKSGGNSSKHSEETKALLKIKNAENMKTTFKQFRKHDELDDLPMYCIYIKKPKTTGVAIYKHPLLPSRKEFTVNKYGTMENAKQALKDFLIDLEAKGVTETKITKRDADLPKGIRKIKNSYFVDKTVKGTTYRKSFSGLTDEENKQNAIAYVNSLID